MDMHASFLFNVRQGHRIQLHALQYWASIRTAAKALRNDPNKHEAWINCFGAVSSFEFSFGVIHTFTQVIKALKWRWVSPFVVLNDFGWELNLKSTPLALLGHMVRESTRRVWLQKANRNRADMFGLASHKWGLDRDATCKVLNKSSCKGIERAYLNNFLTGSIHTQCRMHAAGLAAVDSDICQFCGLEPEDTQHIIYRCPKWEHLPKPFRDVCTLADLNCPPCTLLSGLFLQCPLAVEEFHAQVVEPPLQSFSTGNDSGPLQALSWRWKGGKWWLLAATDGSCTHPTHSLLARTGAGVFFGDHHSCNVATPVPGLPQSAQRGEVAAMLAFLHIVWRPTIVITDSKYVFDTLQVILEHGGVPPGMHIDNTTHFDLWLQIAAIAPAKANMIECTWHPSHLTASDLDLGIGDAEFARMNSGADAQARLGALKHQPGQNVIRGALRRIEFAEAVHNMAISILGERQKSMPAEAGALLDLDFYACTDGNPTRDQSCNSILPPAIEPETWHEFSCAGQEDE